MFTKKSIASEDVALGDASTSTVSRIVVQVEDGGSWSGALTPKGRVGSSAALQSLPYRNRLTATDVAAGTAITAPGLYEIDASGLGVVLTHVRTAGSVNLHVQPLAG